MNNEKSSVKHKDINKTSQKQNYDNNNDDSNSALSFKTDSEEYCSCSSDEEIHVDAKIADYAIVTFANNCSCTRVEEFEPPQLECQGPVLDLNDSYFFTEKYAPDLEQQYLLNTQEFNKQNEHHGHRHQYEEFAQSAQYQQNYHLTQIYLDQDNDSPTGKTWNHRSKYSPCYCKPFNYSTPAEENFETKEPLSAHFFHNADFYDSLIDDCNLQLPVSLTSLSPSQDKKIIGNLHDYEDYLQLSISSYQPYGIENLRYQSSLLDDEITNYDYIDPYSSNSLESNNDLNLNAWNAPFGYIPTIQKEVLTLPRFFREEQQVLSPKHEDGFQIKHEIFTPAGIVDPQNLPVHQKYPQAPHDIYEIEEILLPFSDKDIFLTPVALIPEFETLDEFTFLPEDVTFVDQVNATFGSQLLGPQDLANRDNSYGLSQPDPYLDCYCIEEPRFEIPEREPLQNVQNTLNQLKRLFSEEIFEEHPTKSPQDIPVSTKFDRFKDTNNKITYPINKRSSKIPALQKRKDTVSQQPKTSYKIETITKNIGPVESYDKELRPQVGRFLTSKWPQEEVNSINIKPVKAFEKRIPQINLSGFDFDADIYSYEDQCLFEYLEQDYSKDVKHEEISTKTTKLATEKITSFDYPPISNKNKSKIGSVDDNIPKELIPRSHMDDKFNYDPKLDDVCIGKDICACNKNKIVRKRPKYSSWDFPAAALKQKQWVSIPYDRKAGKQGVLIDSRPHTGEYKEQGSKRVYQYVKLKEIEPEARGKEFKPCDHNRMDSFYKYDKPKGKVNFRVNKVKPATKGQKILSITEPIERPQFGRVDSFYKYEPTQKEIFAKEVILGESTKIKLIEEKSLSASRLKGRKSQKIHLPAKLKHEASQVTTKPIYNLSKKSKAILQPEFAAKIREPPFGRVHSFYKYEPTQKEIFAKEVILGERTKIKLIEEKSLSASRLKGPKSQKIHLPAKLKHEARQVTTKPIYNLSEKSKAILEPEFAAKIKEPPFGSVDSFYKYEPTQKEIFAKEVILGERTKIKLIEEKSLSASRLKGPKSQKIHLPAKLKHEARQVTTKPIYNLSKKSQAILEPEFAAIIKEHPFGRVDSFYKYEPTQKEIFAKEVILGERTKIKLIEEKSLSASRLKGPKSQIIHLPAKLKHEARQVTTKPIYNLSKKSKAILEPEFAAKIKEPPFGSVDSFYKYEPTQKEIFAKEVILGERTKIKLIEEKSLSASRLKGPKSQKIHLPAKLKHEARQVTTKPFYNLSKKSKAILEPEFAAKIKEPPFGSVDSFYKYEPTQKQIFAKEVILGERTKIKLIEEKSLSASRLKGPKSQKIHLPAKLKHEAGQVTTKPIYNLSKKSKAILEPEFAAKIKEPPFGSVDSFYKYEPTQKEIFAKEVILGERTKIKLIEEKSLSASRLKGPKSQKIHLPAKLKHEARQVTTKPFYNLSKKSKAILEPEFAAKIKEPPFGSVDSFYKYEPTQKEIFAKEVILGERTKIKLIEEKSLSASRLKGPKSQKIHLPAKLKHEAGQVTTKPFYNLSKKSKAILEPEFAAIIKEHPFGRVDSFYKYEPTQKEIFAKEVILGERTKIKLIEEKSLSASRLKGPKSQKIHLPAKLKHESGQVTTKPIYNLSKKSKAILEPEFAAKIKEPPFGSVDSFYKYEPTQKEIFAKEVILGERTKIKLIEEKSLSASRLKGPKSQKIHLPAKLKHEARQVTTKPFYNLSKKSKAILEPEFAAKIKKPPFGSVDSFYKYEPTQKEIFAKEVILGERTKIKLIEEKSLSASRLKGPKSQKIHLPANLKHEASQVTTKPIYNLSKKSKAILEPEFAAKIKEPPFGRVDSFYKYEPTQKEIFAKEVILGERTKIKLIEEKSLSASRLKGPKSQKIHLPAKLKHEARQVTTKPIYNLSKKSKAILEPEFAAKIKEPPFGRVHSFYKYEPTQKEIFAKEVILGERTKIKLIEEKSLSASRLKGPKSQKIHLPAKLKHEASQVTTKPIYNLSKKSKAILEPEFAAKIKEPPFGSVDSFYKYEPTQKEIFAKEVILGERTKIKLIEEKSLSASRLKGPKSQKIHLPAKLKHEARQVTTKPIYNLSKKSKAILEPEFAAKIKEPPFGSVDSFYKYEPTQKEIFAKEVILGERTKIKLIEEKSLSASRLKGPKSQKIHLPAKLKHEASQVTTKPIYNLSKKSKAILEPEFAAKIKEPTFGRVDSFYKYEPTQKEIFAKEVILGERTKIKLIEEKSLSASRLKGPKSQKIHLPANLKHEASQVTTKPIYNLSKKSKAILEPEFAAKIKEPPFGRVDSFYKYEPTQKEIFAKEVILGERTKIKLIEEKSLSASRLKGPKSQKIHLPAKLKHEASQVTTKPIYNLSKKSKTILEPEFAAIIKEHPFGRVDSFYKYEPTQKEIFAKEVILGERTKIKLIEEKSLSASRLKGPKSQKIHLPAKLKHEASQVTTKPIYNLSKKSKAILEPEFTAIIKEHPFGRVDSFYKYEPTQKEIFAKEVILGERTKIKLIEEKSLSASRLKGPKSQKIHLPAKLKHEASQVTTKPIYNLSKKSKAILEPEFAAKIKEPPFGRVDSFYKYEPTQKEIFAKEVILGERTKIKLIEEKSLSASRLKGPKSQKIHLPAKLKHEASQVTTKPIYNLSKKSKAILEPEFAAIIKEPPFGRVDSFYKYEPTQKEIFAKEVILGERTKIKLIEEKSLSASRLKGPKSQKIHLPAKLKHEASQVTTKPIYNLSKKSKAIFEPEFAAKIKEHPFGRVDSFYKYEPTQKEIFAKEVILGERTKIKLIEEKSLSASRLKGPKSQKIHLPAKLKHEASQVTTKPIYNLSKKSKAILEPEFAAIIKEYPFGRVDSFYKYEPTQKEIFAKEVILGERTKIKLIEEKSLSASRLKGPKSQKIHLPAKLKHEASQVTTKPIYNLSKKSKAILEPEFAAKIKEHPFGRVDSFYKYEPTQKEIFAKEVILGERTKIKLIEEKSLSASRLKGPKSQKIHLPAKLKHEASQVTTKPIYNLSKKSQAILEPEFAAKIKEPPFGRVDSFYKYEPTQKEVFAKKAIIEEDTKIRWIKEKSLSASRTKGPKFQKIDLPANYEQGSQIKSIPVYISEKSRASLYKPESFIQLKDPPFNRVVSFYEAKSNEILLNDKMTNDIIFIKTKKSKIPIIKPESLKSIKANVSYKIKNDFRENIKTKRIYDVSNLIKTKIPLDKPDCLTILKGPRFEHVDSFYKFEKNVSDTLNIKSTYETAIRSRLPKDKPLSATIIKGSRADEIDLSYMYEKEIKVITYENIIKTKTSLNKADKSTAIKQSAYELATQLQLPREQAESYEQINPIPKRVDSIYKYEPPTTSRIREPLVSENVNRTKQPVDKIPQIIKLKAPYSYMTASYWKRGKSKADNPPKVYKKAASKKDRAETKDYYRTLQPETIQLTILENEGSFERIRQSEPVRLVSDYIFQRSSILKERDTSAFQWRVLHIQKYCQQAEFGEEFNAPNDNVWINYSIEYQRVAYDNARIEAILKEPNTPLLTWYHPNE